MAKNIRMLVQSDVQQNSGIIEGFIPGARFL